MPAITSSRVRKFLLENRESAKRSGHPFLRNEAARLHEFPAAIARRLATNEWKFIQRDAGPINPQALRRAPQGQKPIGQRSGTREDQRNGVEQAAQFRAVIANVFFLRDIRAVKRNDTRLIPAFDEGQEMHAGVPEIDMHQVRAAPFQEVREHLVFAAIDDRGPLSHPLQPAVSERIAGRFWNDLDVAERKQFAVLQRFGHDERIVTVQRP